MSILIKGMGMPDSCFHCKLAEVCQHYKAEHYANKRHEDCPLEEVPETHDKRTETHSCDLIDRQDAIRIVDGIDTWQAGWRGNAIESLKAMPSAQPEPSMEECACCVLSKPEPKWIPFKTRPLTEEEKEEHPEWDCILDCKLPDDGQPILVSIDLRGHECVQYDEFYSDDGSYLDSGYEIGEEAIAWMPLPEPYKEEVR